MPITQIEKLQCDLCGAEHERQLNLTGTGPSWTIVTIIPANDRRKKETKAICPQCGQSIILATKEDEPKPFPPPPSYVPTP